MPVVGTAPYTWKVTRQAPQLVYLRGWETDQATEALNVAERQQAAQPKS